MRARDPAGEAFALSELGFAYHFVGEPVRSADYLRRAAALARALNR